MVKALTQNRRDVSFLVLLNYLGANLSHVTAHRVARLVFLGLGFRPRGVYY